MIVSRIVHCLVDEDFSPLASADRRSFAVRLSLSVEGDDTDENRTAAKKAYDQFLQDIRTLAGTGEAAFEMFSVSVDDATKKATLTRLRKRQFKVLSESNVAELSTRFETWLREDAVGRGKYLDPSNAAPNAGDEVTESELTLSHVLTGAASWLAPLPHKLGLAFTIQITGLGDTDAVVAVPCLGGASTGAAAGHSLILKYAAKPVYEIPYAAAAAHLTNPNYEWCRVTASVAFDAKGWSHLDGATGFIKTSYENDDFARAVRRIEQRAGSLFTGFLAAGQVQWFEDPAKDMAKSGDDTRRKYWLACLAWQVVTTLESSLDTILLALLMPGREDQRDGQILGPFLDLLIDRDFDLRDGSSETRAERRKRLRDAIRNGLVQFLGKYQLPANGQLSIDDLERLLTLLDFTKDRDLSLALVFASFVSEMVDQTKRAVAWPKEILTIGNFGGAACVARRVVSGVKEHCPPGKPSDFYFGNLPPFASLKRQIEAELASLQETVLSETGTERIVASLLGSNEVIAKLKTGLTDQQQEELEKTYREAIQIFTSYLAGGFNGAEAARQSAGSLVADLLLAYHKYFSLRDGLAATRFWHWRFDVQPDPSEQLPPGTWRPTKSLIKLITNFGGFLEKARLGKPHTTKLKNAISSSASTMLSSCLDELFPPEHARFIPDQVPQPLVVPITVDPYIDDETNPDAFSLAFSGVSVLIRQAGENKPWSYACLAETLDLKTGGEAFCSKENAVAYAFPTPFAGTPEKTIAPLPTTVVDGRRELFVTYSGRPFANSAYDDAIAPADRDLGTVGEPFYLTDYPNSSELAPYPSGTASPSPTPAPSGKFQALPPLAYGKSYEIAVHVVGRSGGLPRLLQQSDDKPWQPLQVVKDGQHLPVAAKLPMLRRTAIGRVTIGDAPTSKRINVVPDGVRPLTADYRRLAVSGDTYLDVLRNTDGTGAIALPTAAEPTRVVTLRDLQCWAETEKKLSIWVLTEPNTAWGKEDQTAPGNTTHPKPNAKIPLGAGFRGDLAVSLKRKKDGSIGLLAMIDNKEFPLNGLAQPPSVPSAWIRLKVEGNATVSFADPTPDMSASRAAAGRLASDNLLLLGAPFFETGKKDSIKLWRAPFNDAATVRIGLPRMGLEDFRRWMANESRCEAALSIPANGGGTAPRELFAEFLKLLVALHIGRMENPVGAEWLDRLPDLAVSHVLLSAVPLDSLALGPDELATDTRARAETARIAMPTLGQLLVDRDIQDAIDGGKIVVALELIDRKLGHDLTIKALEAKAGAGGLDFDLAAQRPTLAVPGGVSVRLSARPVVPWVRFSRLDNGDSFPVIDGRLLEYLVGRSGDEAIFDGAHLVVETMVGPLVRDEAKHREQTWHLTRSDWAKQRGEIVHHLAAGSALAYDLVLRPKPDTNWRWRQIGNIDTVTQAWRFSGWPIYTWIKPREYYAPKDGDPKELPSDQASFLLDPEKKAHGHSDFLDFEEEAFFGRDDGDALPHTEIVNPIGHDTRLVTVQWDDKKGASIFRHAATLWSRYADAMVSPALHGACDAWQREVPGDERGRIDRWMRVAMLAKRGTGELTRPQLRALLPLTRRAGDQPDETLSPPVLAFLAEEPFSFGGLAARIASEIRTGVGYAPFEDPKNEGKTLIAPGDIRKEIGPDPRLSLRAMPPEDALHAVLVPEGPVGLTFDSDASRVPAFANSAILLHPELWPKEEKKDSTCGEENFLSVTSCRYLHPDWIIRDKRDMAPAMPASPDLLPLDAGALWLAIEGRAAEATVSLVLTPADITAEPPAAFRAFWLACGMARVERRFVDPTAKDLDAPSRRDGKPDPIPRSYPLDLCRLPPDAELAILVNPLGSGRLEISVFAADSNSAGKRGELRRGAGNAPVLLASIEGQIPEGFELHLSSLLPATRYRTTVSATTALNWVRTNRDFDFVTLSSGNEVNVRDLTARWAEGDANQQVARFKHENQDVWIRSRQSIGMSLTHAQRHMVCLFRETLSGIGRDIIVPKEAWLMPGRGLALPSDAKAMSCDRVSLMEIETPAGFATDSGINCDRTPPLPTLYRLALFDLVAIGADGPAAARHFHFRLRVVGTPLPPTTRVNLRLDLTGAELLDGERFVEFTIMTSSALTSEILLDFVVAQEASAMVQKIRAVNDAGSVSVLQESKPPPSFGLANIGKQLALSVSKLTRESEIWFEVSMLTREVAARFTDFDKLDFDWLFGSYRPELARVANVADIAAMTEAQARLVAISPHIELVRPEKS